MSFRKILSKRLFNAVVPRPPNSVASLIPLPRNSPESAKQGLFRRFVHRRALIDAQSSSASAKLSEFLSLPIGDKIRQTLPDRDGLGGLAPPPWAAAPGESLFGVTVSEARKILMVVQMERVKSKLREIAEASISWSEFSRICVEGCGSEEHGGEFAKMLDQSGTVIVIGNVVFLRPDQIAKSMENIIYKSIAKTNDPRRKELDEMEKQKAVIDQKAREQVKGELYCGLGFVLVQTLAAMRLTFWDLSWDVMEPICFFVTSIHFALGYGFFLKTSTEPTFQGYFQRRFLAKQKRLMEFNNFDVTRYSQLRKVFDGHDQEEDLLSSALNRC